MKSDERQAAAPARGEDAHARRRGDQGRAPARSRATLRVAAGRPAQELAAENEEGLIVLEDERTVREVFEPSGVEPPQPLPVEPFVELVGARGAGEGEEAPIVRVPALGTRAVPRGERCRIVEEEETGVAV